MRYTAPAIEIGFNSRYLLDIIEQIEGEGARFAHVGRGLADRGARHLRCERALRPDADAGVSAAPAQHGSARIGALAAADDDPHLKHMTDSCEQSGDRAAGGFARGCSATSAAMPRCGSAVDDRPVVLTGPNGAGKTNLLEAISFLAPGRGLRRARARRDRPARRGPVPGPSRPPCRRRKAAVRDRHRPRRPERERRAAAAADRRRAGQEPGGARRACSAWSG